MAVKLRLTILQELDLIQYDMQRWNCLFPYEKDYIIRRVRELALQHDDVLGPDLTKELLLAISRLELSR